MRDALENITLLQKRMNELQLENQILKGILERSGISYINELKKYQYQEKTGLWEENQGGRIIHPSCITDEMANKFYGRFWGRQDVYSKRTVKKSTGEVGYFPQCNHFWKECCPRKYGKKIRCTDCPDRDWTKLKIAQIKSHLAGKDPYGNDVIGVYPLLPNGTCRFLAFDFDNHEKDAEKNDFANNGETWMEEVEAMRLICELNGIDPLVERSRSGRGAHVWIFFDKAVSASTARKFGNALLERGAETVNLKSFQYYDRMLPAQDSLPGGGLGNLIALPLQGRALLSGNSAFVDKDWNAYPDQWNVLWSKPRISAEFMETKIQEWTSTSIFYVESSGKDAETREKPWKNRARLLKSGVDGKLSLTLSDGIYVDTMNIQPAVQNQIRRMAAVSNPVFYKNMAMGLSNYDNARWIYMGKEHLSGYIEIPRGLYDELTEQCRKAGITYEITDERQPGRRIKAEFTGQLRPEQEPALEEMLRYDTGILNAATAFGKTVVCSAMIAERKVNTLILLESSSLIEQWEEALNSFLKIEEETPEYQTKTGRIRRRKSIIGKLQGAHDSMTGIIDIAMVGSLCKKGEFHEKLNDYGMVLVDECHHAASNTMANILNQVNARYVYGVTATPMRGDGLEKITYMLLGPIRYRYTAKAKAEAQGIEHLVFPRFTRAVAPRGQKEKMHPNEAYELIRNNDARDQQIIDDIRKCVQTGRTPVVLSRYKDHALKIYERLQEHADHVFLMTGNNSKKEHRQIRLRMQQVPDGESLILIATGSLIGEGFDYPRLDTLIMATPVSFRSVVEQYAGRLNRDYVGKKNVIVYDYVDSHISMFDDMYAKRLRAYKQIGYTVASEVSGEKQTANAIYDFENYKESYEKDLLSAVRSIVISSPSISGTKINTLIKFLRERQRMGVKITVVTWSPDAYGYGKADYWMQLHEEMRMAGIYVEQKENFCEHYAVIDDEIVWYGSMNLLGKENVEDNLMRVVSRDIAAELIEMTFGVS